MHFNTAQTALFYHDTVRAYMYDITTKAVTVLAGDGNSGGALGLPTSSQFTSITDVMLLRTDAPEMSEKCLLVANAGGNNDIRIVPLYGPGYNCKGIVGADNGYVEIWKSGLAPSCMYERKDNSVIYTNG